MIQTTIFDAIYPKYKVTKPIRLIELFAGYGSQALALKYLGVPFEHWKICEWAVKSIQAYKDIHFTDDNTDYSKDLTKENLIDILHYLGISSNYNEPMTLEQIKRLNEYQLRNIYNNIVATRNLVNIQKVKGEDLQIEDAYKYCYIFTYSFPCQDLSLAGKGKGMSDTSTRSGLLWEVERILTECKEIGTLPQILLMENVPQVHGEGNVEDFNKWQLRLQELGYSSYWEDLIATDYGIPQTRNRCFMVSILGNYSYSFPPKQPLKLKLKDMLEDNVDEKYYISDDLLQHIIKTKQEHPEYTQYDRYNGEFEQLCRVWKNKSPTLHTKSNEVKIYIKNTQQIGYIEKGTGQHQSNTIYDGEKISPCLNASDYKEPVKILIKNATSKGYLEAHDGDGINISSRMEYQRGNVQKGKAQTLSTMGGENVGVVVLGNYSPSNHKASRIIDNNYFAPTIKENHGTINATQTNDLRIRKLTPKECFRLMGVKDEDYEKIAKNQSNASLYHLAGDSIVANVLMAIFKELL